MTEANNSTNSSPAANTDDISAEGHSCHQSVSRENSGAPKMNDGARDDHSSSSSNDNSLSSCDDNDSYDSDESYSDDDSSSSSGCSSGSQSSSERSSQHHANNYLNQNSDPNGSGGRNTLIHRRGKHQSQPQCRHTGNEYEEPSRSKYRRSRRKRKSNSSNSNNIFIKCICCQVNKRSTQILLSAFTIWILAQGYYFIHWNSRKNNTHSSRRGRFNDKEKYNTLVHHMHNMHHNNEKRSPEEMESIQEQLEMIRYQRMREAHDALGSAAGLVRQRDRGGKPVRTVINRNRRQSESRGGMKKSRDSEGSTRTERLREGCSTLDWHSYHFPNCNEIHEVDLRRVVEYGRSRSKKRRHDDDDDDDDDESDTTTSKTTTKRLEHNFPWGFVGNGLWRDVFSCDPREEDASNGVVAPAVIKMMKSEHKYDTRNFHRHRRDALVMERLSSSHHLVPIYGYCAQTVLTGAISHTLDDVIYAREHEKVKKWSPNDGYQNKPPLESWMGTDEDGELLATRETEVGRIMLALGVFRGLVDLHEGDVGTSNMEWLPIVHADLQSKQYLVDAQTGRIYLNDFNRCRFITKKDQSTNSDGNNSSSILESCPIYIPTAPGAARSPEEYSMEPLSEKLDVYSAGNILYGIITGDRPWNNERGKHIKADIQKGERPEVDDAIRYAKGTVDAELTRLLDRAYEQDQAKRASAREIVDELEKLLESELKKKEKSPTITD